MLIAGGPPLTRAVGAQDGSVLRRRSMADHRRPALRCRLLTLVRREPMVAAVVRNRSGSAKMRTLRALAVAAAVGAAVLVQPAFADKLDLSTVKCQQFLESDK